MKIIDRNCWFEPTDIFKYGKSEYLKTTLNGLTLKFSKLAEYNDPFEKFFTYEYFNDKDKGESPVLSYDEFKNKMNNNLDEVSVSCFSFIPDDPLMWSHYADSHKGIAYCFNIKSMFSCKHIRGGKVNYSSELPVVRYFNNNTCQEIELFLEQDVILNKSINWAYEQEYRFFTKHSPPAFNPQSLQAIIIGVRNEIHLGNDEGQNSVNNLIAKQVKEYNRKYGTNVQVLHCNMPKDIYRLKIEPARIEYNRPCYGKYNSKNT